MSRSNEIEFILCSNVLDALSAMAAEEGISEDAFVEKLILEEDRKRHVVQIPFGGTVRVKCLRFHSRCAEEQDRITEYEELGN